MELIDSKIVIAHSGSTVLNMFVHSHRGDGLLSTSLYQHGTFILFIQSVRPGPTIRLWECLSKLEKAAARIKATCKPGSQMKL